MESFLLIFFKLFHFYTPILFSPFQEKQAKRKITRADEEKRLAQKKKEEEERRQREIGKFFSFSCSFLSILAREA